MSHLPSLNMSRRAFAGGLAAIGVVPGDCMAAAGDTPLFAGTYAAEGGAGFVAIGKTGSGTAYPAIRNASFGVTDARRGLRYLLDEQREGTVGVYDRSLRPLASRSTHGADPCHLALSPDGTMLAVANYGSGSVALWPLDPATGLPRGEAQIMPHAGHGPDAKRQAGPHAHWVGFTSDGATLHSVDLGADAIFAHRVNRAGGRVVDTAIAYRAAPGSGPRHLARHPRLPIAYLVAELGNTVTVLRESTDGGFVAVATTSTLPSGFQGESFAAHIAVDAAGTRLYVSNRGHDSIAVFAIGPEGTLTSIQHASCGGHWPRFFRLMANRSTMLVANERSGSVARLTVRNDGAISGVAGSIPLPGVVFLGT